MDMLYGWLQFVGIIITIVLGFISIGRYLDKIAKKDLRDYKERQTRLCNSNMIELADLKSTNRVMLQCHDVTLQALDNISKGKEVNGEVQEQRRKLKAHMLDKFAK